MTSAGPIGMNAGTCAALSGVGHLQQSVATILRTPVGSRVQRRSFGSLLPELIDQPDNQGTRVRVYAAVAGALMRWEPRLRISRVQLHSGATPGTAEIVLHGTYVPTEGPQATPAAAGAHPTAGRLMIDLSLLPSPDIIDALSYEDILAALKADTAARLPDLAELIELESEPVTILLQTVAYRELLLRQRVNEAARGVMLAYAAGPDLDQIGANYGIPRLVVSPADPGAVPPVPAVMETDTDFRTRILLSLERFSTAGSRGSYEYHARTASASVQDALATSPGPGLVTVYVLALEGDGTASPELLATVAAALDLATVRPMTDQVNVLSASIVNYSVTAHLQVSNGPDAETIRQAALDACTAYVGTARRLGKGACPLGHLPGPAPTRRHARAAHQPGG